MRWLARQVNLSVSQLERGFTRHVGLGPKLLARQTRLSALTAEAMTPASPGWALLAANGCAYLDAIRQELALVSGSGCATSG